MWTRAGQTPAKLVRQVARATVFSNRGVKMNLPWQPGAIAMTQANWSEDRVEQLKSLWTEGLSASQIARALGGVTRNAVIGKVHRLGLAGRASPSRSERPRLPMAPKAPSVRNHLPAVAGRGGRSTDPGRRQPRHRADHQRPHVPLADRRSRGDPNSISAAARPSRVRPIARPMPARPISRSRRAE